MISRMRQISATLNKNLLSFLYIKKILLNFKFFLILFFILFVNVSTGYSKDQKASEPSLTQELADQQKRIDARISDNNAKINDLKKQKAKNKKCIDNPNSKECQSSAPISCNCWTKTDSPADGLFDNQVCGSKDWAGLECSVYKSGMLDGQFIKNAKKGEYLYFRRSSDTEADANASAKEIWKKCAPDETVQTKGVHRYVTSEEFQNSDQIEACQILSKNAQKIKLNNSKCFDSIQSCIGEKVKINDDYFDEQIKEIEQDTVTLTEDRNKIHDQLVVVMNCATCNRTKTNFWDAAPGIFGAAAQVGTALIGAASYRDCLNTNSQNYATYMNNSYLAYQDYTSQGVTLGIPSGPFQAATMGPSNCSGGLGLGGALGSLLGGGNGMNSGIGMNGIPGAGLGLNIGLGAGTGFGNGNTGFGGGLGVNLGLGTNPYGMNGYGFGSGSAGMPGVFNGGTGMYGMNTGIIGGGIGGGLYQQNPLLGNGMYNNGLGTGCGLGVSCNGYGNGAFGAYGNGLGGMYGNGLSGMYNPAYALQAMQQAQIQQDALIAQQQIYEAQSRYQSVLGQYNGGVGYGSGNGVNYYGSPSAGISINGYLGLGAGVYGGTGGSYYGNGYGSSYYGNMGSGTGRAF